ncbi:MAG TPA: serine hydrolase domain-containing protein [Spirochaetia bacterium]|nr:serine hydrolase domain-containing protein [Spirochaetia bacterium]
MKLIRRAMPGVVIAAAAVLLLYLPDIGPERYTDLATFFRVERRRQAYSGYVVAAVEKGSVLYLDAFGTDGSGKELTVDSPLFIGAASKSMAGAAALSLARERRLDIDRPVRAYLPWFGFAEGAGAEVTARHLLSHTSGVSDADFDDAHDFAPDLEAAVRSLSTARPAAAPGSSFRYLDTGYEALGLVMEKAAGKAYPDIVAERLFKPLGMRRSTARPEGLGVAAPLGNACFFGLGLPRAVTTRPFEAPSTSVVSTATDLGLYLAFLAGPEKQKRPPLPPQAVRLLFEPLEPGIGYGWGWYLEGECAARAAFHDGSLEGFSSRLALWPAQGSAIAVVAAQNSILQSLFSMPSLVEGARRIMIEGSAERPFPLGRLYILLAVVAAVHLFVLALQTGRALSWAKALRDRVEASGGRWSLAFALAHSWLGIALRVLVALAAPELMSLAFGRTVSWRIAFLLEPGLASWLASACFFGVLRNAARLSWLGAARTGRLGR